AVTLAPENPMFRKNLADFLYVMMKQPVEALRHYEKALSLNPRDTETLLILGNIRAESGEFRQAREYYLRVLEIDPSNDLAGKMFDALEARAEEPRERDPETLVREARCLARRGRPDRAVHLLEALLSTCPDHAAAHNDLGNLYCLLQKPNETLCHLKRAVQLAPEAVGFVRDLADAHLAEAGNLEEALALYNKALALNPDDIETLLRIGNVCAARGLHDDARFFYDRVLAIEPCHAMAQENIEQLRKLAPSRSSTRRPKTLIERCRTHIKEGTRNESIVILEDLIAYHVEQNPVRDDPLTPHVSKPHRSFPRDHEDTADILPFGSRIASASNVSGTTLTLETNKRLNQEEIRQKKTNIASLPLNVEIASTNVCNIMPPCVHCWKHIDPHHGYLNRDARHIPPQFLTHLSPYISCAEKVALHGAGEPLTCDYLFEVVKHVDQAACVGFASNGLLLNERNIEKILASNIHFIDFSIDAASPDTYQKIRHNDFNRLVCNIKNLVSLRNERGLRFPEVRINMCLMLENMSEIPAFVKLGKDLDAAVVHLFHLNEGADYQCGWFHYKEQHCRLRPEEHDEYMRAGFASAADLGVNLLFSGKKYFYTCEEAHVLYNREVPLDRFWCSKPWDSLLVQTNGDLYNCCWQTQPIGTLRQQTFLEIWNSKMLQAIRRSALNGTPHPICNNTQNPCPFLGRV
ncbi:MAG TPA: tetratricopeptide repeat protein, partial [Syntrophales bacterium]|nr:tetratricopeptide repeat protein [Syntrophales bacterium]